MLRNILLKTPSEQRRSLLWWILGIVLLIGISMPFYPRIRDNPQYNELINTMPEQLRAVFLSGIQDITSPVGYLNARFYSFLLPLLLLIYTIGFGANAIAGEEERRTFELLLAHPVQRGRVVLEKFGALVIGAVLLGAMVWAALWISAVAVDMAIGGGALASVTVSSVLLVILFGTLALALGAATGKRALSLSVTSVVALASYLLHSFAPLNERVEQVQPVSPFYWYVGNAPLENGLRPSHVTLLVGSTLVLVLLALFAFNRRDVAV